jgi:predicted  nucleic acid-binding Zn-ribbon protein
LERAIGDVANLERIITFSDHKENQENDFLNKDRKELTEFSDTVDTQRHQLDKLESDSKYHQAEIDGNRGKIAKEVAKKEYYVQRLADTENALALQKDISLEIIQQKKILNDLMGKDELMLKNLNNNIKDVKKSIYHLHQNLLSSKSKKEDLHAEI